MVNPEFFAVAVPWLLFQRRGTAWTTHGANEIIYCRPAPKPPVEDQGKGALNKVKTFVLETVQYFFPFQRSEYKLIVYLGIKY
jgi:hypothetical protein